MKKILIFISLVTIYLDTGWAQRPSWSLELNGGLPYNFPSTLKVKQAGYETISMTARYRSEPFTLPIFWDLKISRITTESQWWIELMHHKLLLDNPPDEIEYFSITHGYNLLLINHGWRIDLIPVAPGLISLGAGAVIAHPESMVRGRERDQSDGLFGLGYHFAGLVLNIAASQKLYITRWLFLKLEAKFYPSYSKLKVAEGSASLCNFPIAVIFGIGIDTGL